MIAASFEQENCILDPPEGIDVDDCVPLPVCRGKLESGLLANVSCWKVTKEELEEIQKTGRIWLIVLGKGMPMAALSGSTPFVQSTETGS